MNKHFHVKGKERKKLVKIIAEVLGEKAKYLGMPTAAYQIGEYMVSKDGKLSSSDEHQMQNKMVLDACKDAGFQTEEETEMVQEEEVQNKVLCSILLELQEKMENLLQQQLVLLMLLFSLDLQLNRHSILVRKQVLLN